MTSDDFKIMLAICLLIFGIILQTGFSFDNWFLNISHLFGHILSLV